MNRGEGWVGMIKLGHTATYMGDLYILELGYFSAETNFCVILLCNNLNFVIKFIWFCHKIR